MIDEDMMMIAVSRVRASKQVLPNTDQNDWLLAPAKTHTLTETFRSLKPLFIKVRIDI